MITIVNINRNNFTYNGIAYNKRFSPALYGDNVRVLGAIDQNFELIPFTSFQDWTVDGQSFQDANSLLAALAPVIYDSSLISVVRESFIIINQIKFKLLKKPGNNNLTSLESGDVIEGFWDGDFVNLKYNSGPITDLSSFTSLQTNLSRIITIGKWQVFKHNLNSDLTAIQNNDVIKGWFNDDRFGTYLVTNATDITNEGNIIAIDEFNKAE